MFPRLPVVVKNLLIINGLCFLALVAIKGDFVYDTFAGHYFSAKQFQPWQIITHMFLHNKLDISHLLGNMIMLLIAGIGLERLWGPKRFLTYYFICGIGAFFIHEIVYGFELMSKTGSFFYPVNQPGGVVGASGAIFGLLCAYGLLLGEERILLLFFPFPIKVKYLVLFLVAGEIYSMWANRPGDFVAHYAHIGGLLVGFVTLAIWRQQGKIT